MPAKTRVFLAAETMVPGRLTSSIENLIAAIDFDGFLIMEPGGQYRDDAALLHKARRAADRLLADLAEARQQ